MHESLRIMDGDEEKLSIDKAHQDGLFYAHCRGEYLTFDDIQQLYDWCSDALAEAYKHRTVDHHPV